MGLVVWGGVRWGGVRWGGAVTFHCANTSGCPLALDIHASCYASGCSLALGIQMLQVAVVKPSKQGLRCWTNTEIPVRCKELIPKQTSTRIQRLSLE